jgi:hypothetical protein
MGGFIVALIAQAVQVRTALKIGGSGLRCLHWKFYLRGDSAMRLLRSISKTGGIEHRTYFASASTSLTEAREKPDPIVRSFSDSTNLGQLRIPQENMGDSIH